jgi:drug/metabolite transporter (DMT)-like permease
VLSAVGFALLAAIQPLGIIAFIAILSRGGRRNTWGFIVGWLLCAAVVALLTVALARGHHQHDSSLTIASAGLLQVALGIVALGLLVMRRARRGRLGPGEPEEPELREPERTAGPVAAALVAALLQGWPVVAAAVAAVLQSTDAGVARLLGIALVIVLSSSTYLAAQILSGMQPERTAAWLDGLRRRIETHRDPVVDGILLLAGAWLLVHGTVVQLTQ